MVPRMDIAALIAAKRKGIQRGNFGNEEVEEEKADSDGQDDDGSEEKEGSGDDDSSESSGSGSDSDSGSSSEEEDAGPVDDSHRIDMEDDVLKTRVGKDDEEDDGSVDDQAVEDKVEVAKAAAFFDDKPAEQQLEIAMFSQLTLSRPLLRGVASMGFVKPTPIQGAVIPLALAGRDICASAVTGSGKTAAFLLPVLERLLHRYSGRIKCVILTPTRELAAQCLGMMATLSQFTDLRASLIVGGAKNIPSQAAELRTRPDVVVATPGRLLDHVTNSPGVTLDEVEVRFPKNPTQS